MTSVPDWLPDWRDEKAYQFSDQMDLRLWSWEFLRRNPEYQQVWQIWYVDGPLYWMRDILDRLPEFFSTNRRKILDADEEDFQFASEIRSKMYLMKIGWELDFIDFPEELSADESDFEKTYTFAGRRLAKDFGLPGATIVDPATNNPSPDLINFRYGSFPDFRHIYSGSEPNCPSQMAVESAEDFLVMFDLSRNLRNQWDAIEPILSDYKKSLEKDGDITRFRNRPQVRYFKMYLRVLDAKSYGEKADDIAAVLYPRKVNLSGMKSGRHKVENDFRRAKYIRDEQFQYLRYPE